MRILALAVLALAASAAHAQGERRPSPSEPKAKVPPVEYRSALEGYRPFAEQERRDWRKANEAVREAAKPQPGAPAHKGHGGHK